VQGGALIRNAVVLNTEAAQYVISSGHSIFTVLFALLGGWIGGRFGGADFTQNSDKMLT
jgi:hypothetical protein